MKFSFLFWLLILLCPRRSCLLYLLHDIFDATLRLGIRLRILRLSGFTTILFFLFAEFFLRFHSELGHVGRILIPVLLVKLRVFVEHLRYLQCNEQSKCYQDVVGALLNFKHQGVIFKLVESHSEKLIQLIFVCLAILCRSLFICPHNFSILLKLSRGAAEADFSICVLIDDLKTHELTKLLRG